MRSHSYLFHEKAMRNSYRMVVNNLEMHVSGRQIFGVMAILDRIQPTKRNVHVSTLFTYT